MDLAEARRLADMALRPTWGKRAGESRAVVAQTFWVAPWAWEDQWGYAVAVGPETSPPKKPTHIVTKAGGTVRAVVTADAARLAAMASVGSPLP